MFEVATDLSRPTTCPYTKAFPSQYNSRKNFFFLTKDLLWNTAVECAERAVTTHLLLGIPSYVLAAASLLTAITFISPNMKKRLTSLVSINNCSCIATGSQTVRMLDSNRGKILQIIKIDVVFIILYCCRCSIFAIIIKI